MYDIVIIGAGPAGCAAGIYASRAKLKTLLIERLTPGGKLLNYEKVENYPGFPEPIGAFELAQRFSEHVDRYGVERLNEEVTGLDVSSPVKIVKTGSGEIKCKTIVIASGATPKALGVSGEKEFEGRGVSYCAVCDAPFFKKQDVAVVGGGDTAVEEAVYLTRFANRVYLVHRRDKLRAAKSLQDRAFENDKISFVWNSVVKEIKGTDSGVDEIVLYNRAEDKEFSIPVQGIFVFVGFSPNTSFVPAAIGLDENGFVVTDEEMQTSVMGVFAAGDVRSKHLRQIVTAVSDGAIAAVSAYKYIDENSQLWK